MSTGEYEAVIGLEVHCQLSTRTKIFCSCPASPDEGRSVFEQPINSSICEVCTAQPGALPVLNEQAVRFAIRAGLAVGSAIRSSSTFARKNYFYPDLPRGYQISQYDTAVCEGGRIEIESAEGRRAIRLRRIHLEEDAGKSVHEFGMTLVNLNRAGVPLIEIVGEPDLRTPLEAGDYLRELHAIVTSIGITDGNMQEGNFRCDANVSIRRQGSAEYGTRVEIKNVNSFRFVEKALAFEIQRQIAVVSAGGQVRQETRLYDPQKDQTFAMRAKEEAEDYRYFPDPDLPPVCVPASWIEQEKSRLPELPSQKRDRYAADLGLSARDARLMTASAEMSTFFEAALALVPDARAAARTIANLLAGEISRLANETDQKISSSRLTPEGVARLGELLLSDQLSSTAAKKVASIAWNAGDSIDEIIAREGLLQENDEAVLRPLVCEVLDANPSAVAELLQGKDKVLGFLVGQVMRHSRGSGNPSVIQQMIRSLLIDKTNSGS